MSLVFTAASTQFIYNNSVPVTGVPLSMACWFNAVSATTTNTMISIVDKDTDTHYFLLQSAGSIASDPVRFIARAGGSEVIAATSTGYSTGTWHHACGTSSATNARAAYIDGGSKGTNTTSATPANLDRTAIGALARSSLGQYYDGSIAEVGIWNVALTDAEAVILALGYSPKLVRPSSLVFYAPLIRPVNPSQDIKGGLSLTWNNTPVAGVHPRVFYTGR